MRRITSDEISKMAKIKRLNLVNHLTGYKSANLIGTKSKQGQSNLAIVSSVTHLSSSPAVVGFMQRPVTVSRHTYQNIIDTGVFTINHIHQSFIDKAHYTSAKFDRDQSEFEHSGLGETYLNDFFAPFVSESLLKMAVKYSNTYEIKESNTLMVVGEIESVYLPGDMLSEDGQLDFSQIETVAISGLNNYHTVTRVGSFPYARPGNFPVNLI